MADSKPIILSEDHSLVDHDLKNVYQHWLNQDLLSVLPPQEVKFKKKENIETLKKSVLKHRIRLLTGKDLAAIETEVGKTIDKDEELRKLAKILILEAAGRLPQAPAPPAMKKPTEVSRKRTFVEDVSQHVPEEEPTRKRGRRSIAVTSISSPMISNSPAKKSRRSMMPSIPKAVPVEEEPMDEEEDEEEELDLTDLGPNPTPQMVELKKKKLQSKAATRKIATPKKTLAPAKKKLKAEEPAKVHFSGNNCSIYLFEADVSKKSPGYLDFSQLQRLTGSHFTGANLSFIHTPMNWSPADVFSVTMGIKLMNRKANLENYLIMVGCGVENINLLMEALKRHTKSVQIVVIEREDMNTDDEANEFMLRSTTKLFLLAYFFPNCDREGSLPQSHMVRPNLTTSFRTKNIEDLENTIIHSLSEEGDWILDVYCGNRELALAAQKSGRNAIAIDGEIDKLKDLADKAVAIAGFHDSKFRPEIDGKIQSLL